MSGSIDNSATSNAILGFNPQVKLQDPLTTLRGWQDLSNQQAGFANQVQQLKNAQLENQKGQIDVSNSIQGNIARASLSAALDPDPAHQTPAYYRSIIDDQIGRLPIPQAGQMAANYKAQITDDMTPDQLKNLAVQHASALMGPAEQAAQGPAGQLSSINTGGQTIQQQGPGALSRIVAPGVGPSNVKNTTNTPAPQFVESGGTSIPTSGGQPMAPPIGKTFTPQQAQERSARLVPDPDNPGGFNVVTKEAGEWNPQFAPPGYKKPTTVTSGSGKTSSSGVQDSTTIQPQGQEAQLKNDQESYNQDLKAVPDLQTGVQSLGKALDALNAVATGSGTAELAKARAFAVGLGNIVGLGTGGVNVQDMNRAEVNKYLTDYARMQGSAGRSDAGLEAAFKSNASGDINNAAAQDVVRTNIGRDLRKIAAAKVGQTNPSGSGYNNNKSNYFLNTDPRGFAWDSYTQAQQQAILKEVGPPGSAARNKLAGAIADAKKLGMIEGKSYNQPNVNAAPQLSPPPPPSPPQPYLPSAAALGVSQ